MKILIVGNILKDVYLNLDSRTEHLETDQNNVGWLNLGFDASKHHFFSRSSFFGGAAISMEVLKKLGLDAAVSNSSFKIEDNGTPLNSPAPTYRYILISNGNVSYLTPSEFTITTFNEYPEDVDYLYIDRSANLNLENANKIQSFLNRYPNVKLALYLRDPENPALKNLIHNANLVIAEDNQTTEKSPILNSLDQNKIIRLSEKFITYTNITEKITIERVDTLTHLSFYSILSATILGSFIMGKTVEDSLRLARINIENSTLNSVLSLTELEKLAHNFNPEENLALTAANLVFPGKGILAADESGGSIKKKFAALNISDTFENRHNYRNIFFTTKDLGDYVNGVILFDETARDYADNGQNYVDFLISQRIIPGIKVDQGLKKFPNSDEVYTDGLDNLPLRLREYYSMGLRFAKWRAAFNVKLSDHGDIITPSAEAIETNCRILAEYAKECQSAGLVPIVEPELVYDGNYSIEICKQISSDILSNLFKKIAEFGVNEKACILKTNMILAGKQFPTQSTPEEVGINTAEVLKNHVPPEIAGIVFLSGGQTVEQATENLAAIIDNGPFPWPVTFSFARALQDPALYAWNGNNHNSDAARKAFRDRLIANQRALHKK